MGRSELFLWFVCILLANQLFQLADYSASGFVQALSNRSAFYFLGWYVVLRQLHDSAHDPPATRRDVAFIVVAAALNLVSSNALSWLSCTIIAAYLLATSRPDSKHNAAGAVLLALSLNGLWGWQFFEFFAIYLLRADAALVGALLSMTQPGMTWADTVIGSAAGHSVFIYSPCSSFHNISLGLLCWVSVTKLFRTAWVRSDVLVALAVVATVVGLNGTRLYLMALSPGYFAYWHDGLGATLFALATTLAVLLISLWGAMRGGAELPERRTA
jgi:exosortase/archaeosortase family protein